MRALLLLASLVSLTASFAHADDRSSYLLHCGGCHLPDGRGTPPEVPGLVDDLGRLVQVDGGRAYLVQVPGAGQASASDEELTRIINWILHEFNAATLPARFQPLSVSEVSQARRKVLADPLRRRHELWSRLEDRAY